jgi:selenocysteine lyase/cysteine desulfurase
MEAAIDYLASLGDATVGAGVDRRGRLAAGYGAIAAHERALAARFLEGLGSLSHVRLFGIADPDRLDERTPTFAVRVGDRHPLETATELGRRGIYVWDGHYYAITIMERLGLLDTGGAVRIGFCHYHTADEVQRVLDALADLG